jgi:hypothetical protein
MSSLAERGVWPHRSRKSLRGLLPALADLAALDHHVVVVRDVVNLKRAEREGIEPHRAPLPILLHFEATQ